MAATPALRADRASRSPHATVAWLLALVPLLAACGGSSSARLPVRVPTLPVVAAPDVLREYHVYVTDLVTGDLALFGAYTVHVSASVHGLGLSSDGKALFVTSVSGNALDVLPAGNAPAITHSVPVGAQPVHVVDSRDGRMLFVTNYAAQSVSVIDTATWSKVTDIAVPANPHGIVLSPDGAYAYVACYGGSSVAVLDVAARKLAVTIPIPGHAEPYGIAISADGRYVYVSDNFTNRVDVINTAKRAVVGWVSVGVRPSLMARSADGAALYVADGGSASVHVLNLAGDPARPTVRAIVPTEGYPHGIAVTPDGRYVVVANTVSRNLSVIDAASAKVVATIQSPTLQYPNDVLITP